MHLSEIARRQPEKAAIIMAGSGAATSYSELDRRSRQVAQLHATIGLGTGDHVAVLMDNRPEFLEVLFGGQRRGIYTTPVNWHLTDREAAYVVNDCGARVLFASAPVGDLADRVAEMCSPDLVKVMVGGARDDWLDYDQVVGEQSEIQLPDETEGYYFFYSSGTTGVPKGIEPAHDFPPFGTGLRIDQRMKTAFGFDDTSVYLCPAPLYHAAPIGWSMGTIRNAGTVVLMERFDPVECLRAISDHHVSHVQFVPTMFVRLLKLPENERKNYDVSSLRLVVHAAAPCPPDVKEQIIDWLGLIVLEYYSGSEGSGMTTITSEEWLAHRGSVGLPAAGVVHIVDEQGNELAPGEVGTVYFEGTGGFRYYKDPEKTSAAYNDKGWTTLGDLGHLDDEGYLYLADRRTDLILSGGVNIYPREIEEALVMHPAVADVAVIGVPDEEMGERVKAVVQLAPDRAPSDELQAELMAHTRTRLAGFKCPREWEFVAQLPRTDAGKLLRRRLRVQA